MGIHLMGMVMKDMMIRDMVYSHNHHNIVLVTHSNHSNHNIHNNRHNLVIHHNKDLVIRSKEHMVIHSKDMEILDIRILDMDMVINNNNYLQVRINPKGVDMIRDMVNLKLQDMEILDMVNHRLQDMGIKDMIMVMDSNKLLSLHQMVMMIIGWQYHHHKIQWMVMIMLRVLKGLRLLMKVDMVRDFLMDRNRIYLESLNLEKGNQQCLECLLWDNLESLEWVRYHHLMMLSFLKQWQYQHLMN